MGVGQSSWQQPSEQPDPLASSDAPPAIGEQQPSPFHASSPSRTATPAITRPAMGSAHPQLSVAFNTRPTSRTADRYVHSKVWVPSATTAFDPSALPVRRCAQDSNG